MNEASTAAERLERRIAELRASFGELRSALAAAFIGQEGVVELLLETLLAGGHALVEGAPGLGKTTLVKGLARTLELSFQRIQFTPDLMPTDILGTRILEETPSGGHAFRFEPGPVFAHLVLADEINRATPRTQSALLEAMQERQVTLFGESRRLPEPFCVVATQNPIEMEGTYPLPEAQLDRFLCKIEVRSPGEDELCGILSATTAAGTSAIPAVLDADCVNEMRALVREVPTSSEVVRLCARLVRATDPSDARAPEDVRRWLRYGASPRGGQAVLMLAKAHALLAGRPWVSEDDVRAVAAPALRHRLIFTYEGEATGVSPDHLVAKALDAAAAS